MPTAALQVSVIIVLDVIPLTKCFSAGAYGKWRWRDEITLGFTAKYGKRVALHTQPKRLAQLLRNYIPRNGGKLELVFLNGPKMFDVASHLVLAGVPVVVFWKTKVNDEAAFVFSRAFYSTLSAANAAEAASASHLPQKHVDDSERANEDRYIKVVYSQFCRDPAGCSLVLCGQAFDAGVEAISNVVWPSVQDPLITTAKFELMDPEDETVDPTSGKVDGL